MLHRGIKFGLLPTPRFYRKLDTTEPEGHRQTRYRVPGFGAGS